MSDFKENPCSVKQRQIPSLSKYQSEWKQQCSKYTFSENILVFVSFTRF